MPSGWIIINGDGESFPYKTDIIERTYESIQESSIAFLIASKLNDRAHIAPWPRIASGLV